MMKYLINKSLGIGLITTALMTLSASASILTQIDTFDSGIENWTGMGIPSNGPNGSLTHEITGGPDGAGDAYLQALRGSAPEFHIAIYNTNQWAGDYEAECITALRMDLNHIAGTDPLRIRLMIWGDGGVWGSTSTTPLPAAGGGWNTYTFGLSASDLVYVSGGTGSLSDTLSTVTRIQIRHDYDASPTPPGSHPEHVHGTLGIDNIQAISEPVITSISTASNTLELGISNVNISGTYYVECIEDLTTNNWAEVGSSFEGIKGSTNWTDNLGVATSAFYRVVRDPYHPKVGESATFTKYFHGITGTVHIVNNRTIELRNFSYDGGGPAVVVSVDPLPYPVYPVEVIPWGIAISDYIGNSPPYVNTNLTFTLPDGLDLDDVNYISIWCEDVYVDFASGMFQ